ncbi:GAF domain-containing protein [Rapidithrix thailandica]|uniref:GAF domain-containing protein n=1 Tax=Rapidithrix thailandica TaxID=413964 RepID=A0AAW9RZX7_9BACT
MVFKLISWFKGTIQGKMVGAFSIIGLVILILVMITQISVRSIQSLQQQIVKTRMPTSNASLALMNGINHSLAALRGWVILGDAKFKEERRKAWENEIDLPIAQLNEASVHWTDPDNITRLGLIWDEVERFRGYQQEIEEIAFSEENYPAVKIMKQEIKPLVNTFYTNITALIDLEGELKASRERKYILGIMANVRGTFGISAANLQTYLLSGDENYLNAFHEFWEKNQQNFNILNENTDLLTSAQSEHFYQLRESRNQLAGLYPDAIQMRQSKEWNHAEYWLRTKAAPAAAGILQKLDLMVKEQNALLTEDASTMNRNITSLIHTEWTLLLAGLLLCIVVGMLITNHLIKPINKMNLDLNILAEGQHPDVVIERTDEIGKMAQSLNRVTEGLKQTASFASEIGKGNFGVEFIPLSDQDILGKALVQMRDNLKRVDNEEQMRKWVTEGLAMFGNLQRQYQGELVELTQHIISELVKYIKANQGAIFLVEGERLELAACYAWGKQKHMKKSIEKGEGLIGQTWKEQSATYLTEIPEHFVNISSGLGEANPRSIYISPMIVNEEVFGVIEIASFEKYHKFELEFIDKVAENIGAVIYSEKTTEKTKMLLEDSQQQAEEMRAQEEEMRQNTEELIATQEEMNRQKNELEREIYSLKQIIIEHNIEIPENKEG